eukprot:6187883-Pleurochrysis_carterae.AAC.3
MQQAYILLGGLDVEPLRLKSKDCAPGGLGTSQAPAGPHYWASLSNQRAISITCHDMVALQVSRQHMSSQVLLHRCRAATWWPYTIASTDHLFICFCGPWPAPGAEPG